jgi:regulator of cell morphogenesis and NO signaling
VTTRIDIDPSLSVNETIRRWPASVVALNAFGVDACCGGAATLRAAAADADVPLDDLLAGIRAAVVHAVPRVA